MLGAPALRGSVQTCVRALAGRAAPAGMSVLSKVFPHGLLSTWLAATWEVRCDWTWWSMEMGQSAAWAGMAAAALCCCASRGGWCTCTTSG